MSQLRPVDLEGRVALVTDGTDEVGAAFVDLLGSAGAEVAVAAEPGPALTRMAIRSGVETIEWDSTEPDRLSSAAAAIGERLDLLVCVLGPLTPDLDAAYASLREVAGTMVAGGRGGRILVVGPNGDLPAGPIRDAAAVGIAVNGVLHGPLRPDEYDDGGDAANDPVGTARATDVARAALWLLDPEVVGVSGCVVDLDAGR